MSLAAYFERAGQRGRQLLRAAPWPVVLTDAGRPELVVNDGLARLVGVFAGPASRRDPDYGEFVSEVLAQPFAGQLHRGR